MNQKKIQFGSKVTAANQKVPLIFPEPDWLQTQRHSGAVVKF